MDKRDADIARKSFAVETGLDITEASFREFKTAVCDERFELYRMLREAKGALEMIVDLWGNLKQGDLEIVRRKIREIDDTLGKV